MLAPVITQITSSVNTNSFCKQEQQIHKECVDVIVAQCRRGSWEELNPQRHTKACTNSGRT